MDKLDQAVKIAAKIHTGFKGRNREPAILHPIRVMMKMNTHTGKIVAVLHDVVESGKITVEELLKKGFSKKVCRAVDLLSRNKWEKYDHYLKRVQTNSLAVKVKLEDLEDNLQQRMNQKKLSKADRMKIKKIKRAYKLLCGKKLRLK